MQTNIIKSAVIKESLFHFTSVELWKREGVYNGDNLVVTVERRYSDSGLCDKFDYYHEANDMSGALEDYDLQLEYAKEDW